MRTKLLWLSIMMLTCPSLSMAAKKLTWEGKVPAVAKDKAPWGTLIDEMSNKKMNYGLMAAAARLLGLFNELEVKELAYQTVISLADEGYPFPVQPMFLAGDLSASGDYDFVNSYNLYKAILNKDKGLERWSNHYFENVDKKDFTKYWFFAAIEAYAKEDFKTAEEELRKILAKESGLEQRPFIRKVARTLARTYFDREMYEKAWDIYESFLLRINPVIPSDYLEAAWTLYYLRRYQDALGMVFNIESKSVGNFVSLEKYTLRALSYRNMCAIPNAESLMDSFNKEFGTTITGIKRGESLSNFQQLVWLDVPENLEFQQISLALIHLNEEKAAIPTLPEKVRKLASYLYDTEIEMLSQKRKARTDAALETATQKLIMMNEQLRFLKFDIQREKYNPDTVFRQDIDWEKPVIEEMPDKRYTIRWVQFGDYWRDERLKYRAMVPYKCIE